MMEKIKRKGIVLFPALVCLVGVIVVSLFWLKEYRKASFEHISKFCEIIMEENPQMELQVLSAIKEYQALTNQEIEGNVFLTKYGYRSDEFCKELGFSFPVLSFIIFLITTCCFFVSIRYMDRRNRRRIAELTNYLEQVNIGAYGTVIQTKEDEFSHLQDEMYKTVTELYQTREAAVKAKISFADNLANIAHQLKTPITAAFLSLQLMENTVKDDHIGQIKKQLERLGSLEESLLTLSRIDSGTLRLERSSVDIYTALNLAADNLSDLIKKEGVTISIPDKGCIEITGDLEWTMEAFINLIKNCMEHSPEGGTIHCDYFQNPLYVGVLIWDEGEGFCSEDIPHLFERFYRGKRVCGSGIGIGLALAKSIFELQNGNISARNLPDGGACYEIRMYSH